MSDSIPKGWAVPPRLSPFVLPMPGVIDPPLSSALELGPKLDHRAVKGGSHGQEEQRGSSGGEGSVASLWLLARGEGLKE